MPDTPSAPQAQKTPTAGATPALVDGSEHYLAIALPAREHPSYAAMRDLLAKHGFTLETSNRKWWLRDRHKTLNFLAAQGARLRGEFAAQFSPNFLKNTAHLRPAEVAVEVDGPQQPGDRDDGFSVTLALRAGAAPEAEVRAAVAANRGYIEAGGQIVLIDAAQLDRLARAQQVLAGGSATGGLAPRATYRVGRARLAETQDILENLSPGFKPPEAWRARTEGLRHLARLAPAPLAPALDAQLRPYQRLGVAWLWHLCGQRLGGILADEMGLGKTLQALGLLSAIHGKPAAEGPDGPGNNSIPETVGAALRRDGSRSRPKHRGVKPLLQSSISKPSEQHSLSLVVAPASLLENWRREAARFAPQLRMLVHHGDRRLAAAAEFAAIDVVITSYGTLARDRELLAGLEFACVIADEAQHIKNRRTQNAAALRSLRAGSRFLLTGTPVENSLDDLRSLFEFLLPGYLARAPEGARGDERAWFDRRLREQVAPYILRRTKQGVAPELPPRLEQVLWCELLPAQAALYRATQEKTERELFDLEASGAGETKLRLAALTQLLRLRQICCDPRLIEAGREPPGEAAPPFDQSGKLEAFRELLAEAIDDGHRLLVFSQFTSLLALLRTELNTQAVGHCYLDGAMSREARQAEVDRFQSSPDVPVFLLSLKAGGTGLNLTGADTIVHFDPWWNPAVEAQATDRAHRIGQTRTVTSYKLIAAGTVEEKVLALQDTKRALLADIFEASTAAAEKLSLADLKSLLTR